MSAPPYPEPNMSPKGNKFQNRQVRLIQKSPLPTRPPGFAGALAQGGGYLEQGREGVSDSGPPARFSRPQSGSEFSDLQLNSLRNGTGNFWRPNREFFGANRKFNRRIRET